MKIDDPGIKSWRRSSLSEIAAESRTWLSDDVADLAIAIRWEDGEIADDVLVLEIDPYSGLDDDILEFEGHSYDWDFTGQQLRSAISFQQEQGPIQDRDVIVRAIRYHLEFDAFLDFNFRVGGRWEWGKQVRIPKRTPREFSTIHGAPSS